MEQLTRDLLDFLDASPTSYHAAYNIEQELLKAGYSKLLEAEKWSLAEGGKYFVSRGDSTVIAFRIPCKEFRGFMMSAAHTDHPNFKVREMAELPAGKYLRLSVDTYGGITFRTWMDRPLSVAGRVMVKEKGKIVSRLVNVDRDLLVIPSVSRHQDREVNEKGGLKANIDMLPLFCEGTEKGGFRRLIAEKAGVAEENLLATDLHLYIRVKSALLGLNEEFIGAPAIDDLLCVFGCMRGFLEARESESVQVLALFDHEEIGSKNKQGADSTLLHDVLRRINSSMGRSEEEYLTAMANSFMVSADNAHAVHPAHPEYSDAAEAPEMNRGIVIKSNANQNFTTDGLSCAVFSEVCKEVGVPTQRYSVRADMLGGTTLGNVSERHVSVSSIDVGLPQLAMHSSYEVAGTRDIDYMVRAMTAYYGKSFRMTAEGIEL